MRVLGDETTGELAATTWWGLCNACHHHTYELTPTAAEIQYLIDQVARLTGLITYNHNGNNGS